MCVKFDENKPMTKQYCEIRVNIGGYSERPMQIIVIRRWSLPLGINRKLGDIEFKFESGGKLKFRRKKLTIGGRQVRLEYDRGDYKVLVKGVGSDGWKVFSDGDAWGGFLMKFRGNLPLEKEKTFLQKLYDIYHSKLKHSEAAIYSEIQKIQGLDDGLKAFLYYAWHRVHVEERAYPSKSSPYYREDELPYSEDLNGGKTFLGATHYFFVSEMDPKEVEKIFRKPESKKEALRYFLKLRDRIDAK